ncbi:MAG: PIN domain-containing protein [Betaproteobacteria bacterium]|nr:PIN domain-containing protein [Betaproteobacteria bacterium]
MRVFLDANVLFSAAHRAGSPLRAFFRLAETGICDLLASAYSLDEARRNIARKYPVKSADLEHLIAQITICREAGAEAVHWARSTGLPDKDAPILAAAAQARADILVTGDRTDFGSLYERSFRGVEVLPPRTALERILADAVT